jgi:phosphopantetheinyl transferase
MYYHPLTYSTDPNTTDENRTRFYKKTDTQKNQERRDKEQQRQALTQTYEEKLLIHQYYGNDGQPQFARGPDGKSYLGGGKPRQRKTPKKSKKAKKSKKTRKR